MKILAIEKELIMFNKMMKVLTGNKKTSCFGSTYANAILIAAYTLGTYLHNGAVAITNSINLLIKIVSLTILLFSGSVAAGIIQDQSSGGPAGFTSTRCLGCNGSIFDIAQTFTVGQDGILAQVDIYNVYLNLSNGGSSTGNPLLFDIRNTTSGELPVADNSLALATLQMLATSMPTSAFSPKMVFDLRSFNLNVNAGDVLSLVLRSNNNVFAFGTSANNAYSGGQYAQRFSANAEFPDFIASSFPDGTDLSFSTYVDVSAVPEPSVIALFVLGLFGMFFTRRRCQS